MQRISVGGFVFLVTLAAARIAFADPWQGASRVLWADPLKASLPNGAARDLALRSSPQNWDWFQWAPSKALSGLTQDEMDRAARHGYSTDEVYAEATLLDAPGCSRVQAATLDPPHKHDGGPLHRDRSSWSAPILIGNCLNPPPPLIHVPEPAQGRLLSAGLLLLTILHLRRRRRTG